MNRYLRMKKVARIGTIEIYKDALQFGREPTFFELVYPDGGKIVFEGWTFEEVLEDAIRIGEKIG